MTIRGIIFDFGGVFSSQHEALAGFSAAARRFARQPQELYDLLYSGEAWQLAKVGRISTEEYWRRVMVLLGLPEDHDVQVFLDELFEGDAIDAQVVAIARLLRRRYPLALLSNATDNLELLLAEKYGLADLFEVVVNSARVGVPKPERRAYELALEGLGLAAHEVLFIDDKRRNIDAAVALGIPSMLYTTPAALARELLARGLLREGELAGLQLADERR